MEAENSNVLRVVLSLLLSMPASDCKTKATNLTAWYTTIVIYLFISQENITGFA
jgi:hypothetical protein